MKQLCFLSPPGGEHRFDDMLEGLDIVPSWYGTDQINSLVAFVTREKTINQQDYIVFDLTGTDWSQEHILSAVQQLRRFAIAQLIFIAPAGDDTALLFGKLAAFRVTDLIATDSGVDLREALRACLVQEDRDKVHRRLEAMQNAMATAADKAVAPLKIPRGMRLNISVGGTMPRIGVTTQTFGLYHYLKGLGFAPCVLDSGGKLTGTLTSLYEDKTEECEGYLRINGLPFCTERSDRFNAYVQDVGVVSESVKAVFCAADISVLMGGTKPWELPALAAALAYLKDLAGQLVTLISFAADGDLETVGKYLGPHSASVPYHPDLWSPGGTAAYQAAVLPCLKKLCGGPSR